jgi:uncharacterized protein with HEPN domain
MAEAAREALGFAKGKKREDLDDNRMLVLALVKDIETIGEAASKVGRETREKLSGIPWADIIVMRHRLIHDYFSVDLDIVWATVRLDLPSLVQELERALL